MTNQENKSLEEAFEKLLSGLAIRTEKESRISNLFGLLDKPPYVKVSSGKEMSLENAKKLFYGAYYTILDGKYSDATAVTINNPTFEYFFNEGIKLARELQGRTLA